MSATLITIGSMASLLGVAFLFVFGMPFRTRNAGTIFLTVEDTNPAQVQRAARFGMLGYLGIAFIVLGAAYQITGVFWVPVPTHAQIASEPHKGSARLVGILGGREPDFYLLGE